jgi:hypothetical protein
VTIDAPTTSPDESAPTIAAPPRRGPGRPSSRAATNPCPYCDKVYRPGGQLTRHMRSKHPELPPLPGEPTAPATSPRERAPSAKTRTAAPKRADASEVVGQAFSAVGAGLGLLPIAGGQFAPLGRALAFEAPVAGKAVDQALAGGMVDRLALQPLARSEEKWKSLGSVLTVPICVALLCAQPQLNPLVYPILRQAIRPLIGDTLREMRRLAEEDARLNDELADLASADPFIAGLMAEGLDPVDVVLQSFLGAPAEDEPMEASE